MKRKGYFEKLYTYIFMILTCNEGPWIPFWRFLIFWYAQVFMFNNTEGNIKPWSQRILLNERWNDRADYLEQVSWSLLSAEV